MPSTSTQLFDAVGLRLSGSVPWGTPPPTKKPGVYTVSLSQDPTLHLDLHPTAPIDAGAVQQWISRVSTITIDGVTPTAAQLITRLNQFWLSDESILYIGKATALRSRIRQYYNTLLGDHSPHAGGHWLKTLSILRQTYVHFAEVAQPERAEGNLMQAFIENVSPVTLEGLRDPHRPFPFGNLEYSLSKAHGIGGSVLK